MPEQNVIDEMGGPEVVHEVIEDMYRRVFADEALSGFFEGVDQDRLIRMQYEFVLSAFGGPVQYTGAELRSVHQGKNIQPQDYSKFVTHLVEAMEARDMDRSLIDQVLAELAMYRDKIVGISNVDG